MNTDIIHPIPQLLVGILNTGYLYYSIRLQCRRPHPCSASDTLLAHAPLIPRSSPQPPSTTPACWPGPCPAAPRGSRGGPGADAQQLHLLRLEQLEPRVVVQHRARGRRRLHTERRVVQLHHLGALAPLADVVAHCTRAASAAVSPSLRVGGSIEGVVHAAGVSLGFGLPLLFSVLLSA